MQVSKREIFKSVKIGFVAVKDVEAEGHRQCSSHAAMAMAIHCYHVSLLTVHALLCIQLASVALPSVGIRHALWALMTALSSRMAVAALLSCCCGRTPFTWRWPHSSHAVKDVLHMQLDGRPWRSPLSGCPTPPLGVNDSYHLSQGVGRTPLKLLWPHSFHVMLATLLSSSEGRTPLATQ